MVLLPAEFVFHRTFTGLPYAITPHHHQGLRMKANPWFRMYSDFIFDEKIEFIAFEDQRHYVFILCMKNSGLLDKAYPQPGMLDRVVSKRLGLFGDAFESARRRLVEAGLIDAAFQPIAWDKRQFISDTSADRTKAYRDRMKRHSDVTVTVQEAETDTDTEAEIHNSVEFETVWQRYPNRPGKSKAASLKAWNARIKAGCTAEEMLAGVVAYAAYCQAAKTEPSYIKQPATFFGPDLHFRADWTVPAKPMHTSNRTAQRAATSAGLTDTGDHHDEPTGYHDTDYIDAATRIIE